MKLGIAPDKITITYTDATHIRTANGSPKTIFIILCGIIQTYLILLHQKRHFFSEYLLWLLGRSWSPLVGLEVGGGVISLGSVTVRDKHPFSTTIFWLRYTAPLDDWTLILHDRLFMELFCRRRWTTGLAQKSNMYGMLPGMWCIIIFFWGGGLS